MKLVVPQSRLSSESSNEDSLSLSTSSTVDSASSCSFLTATPPVQISHSIVHCGKKVTLTGLRCDHVLYIYMSKTTLANLSKQCLVSFLDYAQEELKLQMACIFFKRCVPDCKSLMHNFNFFGFRPVTLDQLPSVLCGRRCLGVAQEYHFMVYELEADDSYDEEDG